MNVARFLVFNVLSWMTVVIWGVAAVVAAPFGHQYPYGVARNWCKVISFLARTICGLRYKVIGKENFPEGTGVMLIKHSSAFETYLQILEFPRACWVLKKELLYVPFFGWALKGMRAIAIDRSAGNAAVKQVIEQGKARIAEGLWVSIFPEGTRMAPGKTKRYGISGTLLAQEANAPIVPIAHNAGYHWPRHAKSIVPGEVVFVVGKPIDPVGKDPREINDELQQWVEQTVADIVARKYS